MRQLQTTRYRRVIARAPPVSHHHGMRGIQATLGSVVMAGVIAVGCGTTQPPLSEIRSGPDGLRTFTWTLEAGGVPILCNASAALSPLTGILRGDAAASAQPVWLEAESGRRLSIIWPAGFAVQFEPRAALRNEVGGVVARDGDRVRLHQVPVEGHAGTYEDPYVASGVVFGGCYPYITNSG